MARARAGRYAVDGVTRMRHVTPEFIARTFDRSDSDFVVAENFLFHLSRTDAARAGP